MSDLLQSTRSDAEVDVSALKINGLALAGIIFAFLFSFSLYSVFSGSGVFFAIISLTSAALFLVIVFLQSIFVKDSGRIVIMLFLEVLAAFLPFIFNISGFLVGGAVISYLFLLWGSLTGKSELQSTMKIKVLRLSGFVLPKAITALSLLVAASYVSFFQEQNLVVSRDTFMKIMPTADAVVQFVYPNLSLQDSFESAISAISGMPSPDPESIEASRKKLSGLINSDFDTKESLVNIIYDAYKNYAIAIPPSQKIVILAVLGAFLFLTIRTVGAPVYWLAALLTAFIYEILIALGFAIVVLETRSKEVVLLK